MFLNPIGPVTARKRVMLFPILSEKQWIKKLPTPAPPPPRVGEWVYLNLNAYGATTSPI